MVGVIVSIWWPILLGQDGGATTADPSMWEQFGPFAIVFVLMAAAILDQRATIRAQAAELKEVREQMLSEVVPVATRMVDTLKDVADTMKRGTT